MPCPAHSLEAKPFLRFPAFHVDANPCQAILPCPFLPFQATPDPPRPSLCVPLLPFMTLPDRKIPDLRTLAFPAAPMPDLALARRDVRFRSCHASPSAAKLCDSSARGTVRHPSCRPALSIPQPPRPALPIQALPAVPPFPRRRDPLRSSAAFPVSGPPHAAPPELSTPAARIDSDPRSPGEALACLSCRAGPLLSPRRLSSNSESFQPLNPANPRSAMPLLSRPSLSDPILSCRFDPFRAPALPAGPSAHCLSGRSLPVAAISLHPHHAKPVHCSLSCPANRCCSPRRLAVASQSFPALPILEPPVLPRLRLASRADPIRSLSCQCVPSQCTQCPSTLSSPAAPTSPSATLPDKYDPLLPSRSRPSDAVPRPAPPAVKKGGNRSPPQSITLPLRAPPARRSRPRSRAGTVRSPVRRCSSSLADLRRCRPAGRREPAGWRRRSR